MLKRAFLSAIILMAGKGNRFGSAIPKQFHLLGDRPLYRWSLDTIVSSNLFQEIIIVTEKSMIERIEGPSGNIKIIEGGITRQDSSYNGLLACDPRSEYLLVHDAARPFVTKEILEKNIEAVFTHKAVNTCIPATDTIVISKNHEKIDSIPNREQFFHGQTPQTFAYDLIYQAHKKAKENNLPVTCDCGLVAPFHDIHIVKGSAINFKVTTFHDLQRAQAVARDLSLATSTL